MAGRGRGMVLPAWMTANKGSKTSENANGSVPGGLQQSSQPENGVASNSVQGSTSYGGNDRRERQPNSRHRSDRYRDGRRGGYNSRRRSRSRNRGSYRRGSAGGGRTNGGGGGVDREQSRERAMEALRRPRKRNFDVMPEAGEQVAPLYPPTGNGAAHARGGNPSFGGFAQGGFPGQPGMSGNPQQTRHARRLYVGGVEHVSEDELRRFFQESINKALGKEENPVISVYLNLERRFAFVELNDVDLTTACMDMDGIVFRGAPLKIRRPNDFRAELLPPPTNMPVLNLAALGLQASGNAALRGQVPEGPNKVFFGGVPYHLSDNEIKELLEAFGPLKALHVVRDPATGTSKGYGFCEYEDPSKTDAACTGLNGIQLGDRTLNIRRAFGNNAGVPGAPPVSDPSQMSGSDLLQMTTAMAGAPMAQMGALPGAPLSGPVTRILVLMNMVTPGELEIDEEYGEIVEDIQEECTKFGRVMSVVIPRPSQGKVVSGVGKVFVEYSNTDEAAKAREALEGRKFAERIVVCDYLDESKFTNKEFD